MSGFAIYKSPLGLVRMDYEDGVIIRLRTVDSVSDWGQPTALTEEVFRQLEEYFDGSRREFSFPYELRGTEFQKKVWRALEKIPYGRVRSYGDIAGEIGCPTAARAVGAANGKNPIWIVVPCHRVVGTDGSLTGYAGGIEMKKRLLELERKSLRKEKQEKALTNGKKLL